MSNTSTFARIDNDGELKRIKPDGSAEPLPVDPLEAQDDEAAQAAALDDPDNPPLTDERLAQLSPVARTRTLRRALRLTQEEFAARYHIPLGTLRDWEQGRTQPDQPTRAYLTVIANDPEGVFRALSR